MTSQPMTVEQMADALFVRNIDMTRSTPGGAVVVYQICWEIAVNVVAERERLAHAPRGQAKGEGGAK